MAISKDEMTGKAHQIFDFILDRKYIFAMIFFSVSFSTFAFLYALGMVPEAFQAARGGAEARQSSEEARLIAEAARKEEGRVKAAAARGEELPTHIRIEKIGVDTAVVNPESASLAALNEELKKGAVRYPTSGKLGSGNLFLFGHSTSLPVVNNKAYKAFNGLGSLNPGDVILVESGTKVYVYKVYSVRLTETDDALVDFKTGRNMLTLSTCNVLGAKEERYVVEADFVESRPLR